MEGLAIGRIRRDFRDLAPERNRLDAGGIANQNLILRGVETIVATLGGTKHGNWLIFEARHSGILHRVKQRREPLRYKSSGQEMFRGHYFGAITFAGGTD